MTKMTSWVHQYAMRDLLDDAFDLFKEQARPLLLAGLIPYLLPTIYIALMRIYVIKGNLLQELTEDAFLNMIQSWTFWGYIGGFYLLFGVSSSISFIAQCRIATHHAMGRTISLADSFRLMAKPFWSSVVVSIVLGFFSIVAGFVIAIASAMLAGLLILLFSLMGTVMRMLGTLLGGCIYVLGIEAAVLLGVLFTIIAYTVLAIEHAGPFTAIGKAFKIGFLNFKAYCTSIYLVTRTYVIIQLILTMVMLGGMFIARYVNPTLDVVMSSLLFGLTGVAFSGILASYAALVYIDGRCRTEALDLLCLAQAIGIGDEFARAFNVSTPAAAPTYPNYAGAPVTAPIAAAPGLTAPQVSAGYPDYSVPPPAPPSAEETAAPDAAPAAAPAAENTDVEDADAR